MIIVHSSIILHQVNTLSSSNMDYSCTSKYLSIDYFEGWQVIVKKSVLLTLKIDFVKENSADPHELSSEIYDFYQDVHCQKHNRLSASFTFFCQPIF